MLPWPWPILRCLCTVLSVLVLYLLDKESPTDKKISLRAPRAHRTPKWSGASVIVGFQTLRHTSPPCWLAFSRIATGDRSRSIATSWPTPRYAEMTARKPPRGSIAFPRRPITFLCLGLGSRPPSTAVALSHFTHLAHPAPDFPAPSGLVAGRSLLRTRFQLLFGTDIRPT